MIWHHCIVATGGWERWAKMIRKVFLADFWIGDYGEKSSSVICVLMLSHLCWDLWGWSTFPTGKGCSAWRRQGSRGTSLQPFIQFPKEAARELGGDFLHSFTGRTMGNGFQLKESSFRFDIREKFLIVTVVRHWRVLLRETVEAPSLRVFKGRLDGVLSKVV